MKDFGGKLRLEHKLIGASFSGKSLCFHLDLICLMESIKNFLEEASQELYGHICVLGNDIAEEDIPHLIRGLPSDIRDTGIWCGPALRSVLEPYLIFGEPLAGPPYIKGYSQLKEIRDFSREHPRPLEGYAENISRYLNQGKSEGKSRNTVIVGSGFTGKRKGLHRYCSALLGDFPPLTLSFRKGANAVVCIADALTPPIRGILGLEDESSSIPRDLTGLGELEALGEFIFRERLRDQVSDFLVKQGKRFLFLLLESYRAAADKAGLKPALILEDLQAAAPLSRLIVSAVYASLPQREEFPVYGTCTDLEALEPWEELFPRIVKFSPGAPGDTGHTQDNPDKIPELPGDLWELAYVCALFGVYFPPYLVPRLLEEEGKNPLMISRGLAMLSQLGVIYSPGDPTVKFAGFIPAAEETLGERGGIIRAVVRNRLLVWVRAAKLKPCYRLLEALRTLGGGADETLILDALCGDVVNGAYAGIEGAVAGGGFAEVVGKDRAELLLSIFKTQRALNHGSPGEISGEAFSGPLAAEGPPGLRVKLYANYACCRLGICDIESALVSVKEGLLISQRENSGRDLAHLYRLFALVEFANRRLSDSIDYFAFAVENAEKTEDHGELALAAYYAAGAHFIVGNIAKAERLALQAEKSALVSGRSGWADRSCFLRGRIRFEMGRYQEALDIFTKLEQDLAGPVSEDLKQTLSAWIFRTGAYLHNQAGHSGGLDAEFFEVEGAFFSGEYRKTLELAGRTEKDYSLRAGAEKGDRFLFIEQPDWRSGFAQCELFLFPLREFWDRMILTYRALALCHHEGASIHDREEAVRDMHRVMRAELPEEDPNAAFYLYSYYLILKKSGAPEVDMNTAISLAFKRLQRRASRIDDNEVKRSFLTLPYWNGLLAAAAKEHKLI
jgi:tetratricopeptide (TPR) repeat protein